MRDLSNFTAMLILLVVVFVVSVVCMPGPW
jgi:hypothetical protein